MNHHRIAAAALVLCATAAQAAPMTKSPLIECTPEWCGGRLKSSDTELAMNSGWVSVAPDGRVTISISGLRNRTTGLPVPLKVLELHFGTVLEGQSRTLHIGTVMTDWEGNYKGQISTDGGQPFKFEYGTAHVGNFYVGDANASRTHFVTGFSVWR